MAANEDIRHLQTALTRLGFKPGKIDGTYGPKTQGAVDAYARDHRVTTSGPCLRRLIAQSYADLPRRQPVWVHTMRAHTGRGWRKWIDRCKQLGVDGVIFTIHGMHKYTPFVSIERLTDIIEAYREAGIKVAALIYPAPLQEHFKVYLSDLPDLDVLYLDLEENWRPPRDKADRAGIDLIEYARESQPNALIGVTSIASRGEDYRLEKACELADFVAPQGMSSNKKGKDKNGDGKPDWSSIPPGRSQLFARTKWSGHGRPQWMVLAAYGQNGIKGHTPASALRQSYESALDSGAVAVSYWELGALWRRRAELPFEKSEVGHVPVTP